MLNKRGASTILFFKLIGLTLAIIVFISLLIYAKGISDNTTLERNAMARDIALLLTTIYAAPGDITYEYPVKTKANIEIENGAVKISDPNGGTSAEYWYAENPAFNNPELKMKQPDKLIFLKKDNKISIIGAKNE